jgi:hypothetical protein
MGCIAIEFKREGRFRHDSADQSLLHKLPPRENCRLWAGRCLDQAFIH